MPSLKIEKDKNAPGPQKIYTECVEKINVITKKII